ncbi:MAG: bifunctional phosphoribosyl-AMP cyclohydrolase/phosphoribosyl-ATP diphosphatase HisIE [Haliscomenobacter sp.]|jgi:phosphoribosyl-ATP pyrophosphohydrolase/phosphoribosyl-AMP cyclohydrolase|nr:bifunctional phosphoribosyl-AMP cyclohydrolase/phosphoribosyl-ATP diphosphatase HisIE [Haliscomenobacter sp.]MBP9078162.1 bifunctional phosphoribosyl-AMP cyclohydrolase/phosphoribosyl-ATP diphosphatase HisIE [Haliscomenobacter sp.]MBP9875150.1 bifunctional phosphoribosyl-AMP cyclohydrolase/phosphoribosyl-ATP diphosphatase HisIE [Haliscomenobacter sp.]MBV6429196.1 Histidine biosynthesis bifunctional protein HisIE [Haliscomenobacter sp.]
MATIDFEKSGGLVPAIIQDEDTHQVLMLGYMNQAAFDKTLEENVITFYSRSKDRLWTKGETSGHFLHLVSWKVDCDQDTLLFRVHPQGPVCHTGSDTCFDEPNVHLNFLEKLETVIRQRRDEPEGTASYTASLFRKGINKVAQKVGEEAVELVIEAKDDNETLFLGEAADLLFHYLVLLAAKGYALKDVVTVLQARNK